MVQRFVFPGVAVVTALTLTCSAARAADDKPAPLQIGMLASFYRGVPDSNIKASTEAFKKLMNRDVGRDGNVETIPDPFDMGKQLADGKLQIAVFHGFEYAWIRTKYPALKPLTLAVNQKPEFRCLVVVRKADGPKDFDGLKDKVLAVATGSREESRVYVDRLDSPKGKKKHFAKYTTPPTVEDALDDVVDDVCQATVVDNVALETYQKRKPARFDRLRIVSQSD
ncbi:MAG TPA: PhnD/SsuA/transferrin family substrate-binding protein, partial [Chloroflexota bacterium]|nr:PhnD/SsuA/transferrin family substrate-binding protein [Chloroflexota bacterium]